MLAELEPTQSIVKLCQWKDTEAEADEMWSFVQSKAQQRWLWHAIDHHSGAVRRSVCSTQRTVRTVWDYAVLHRWMGNL